MIVTVITPAWVDERGTDIPDWENATETDEDWRSVQPLNADEANDLGRQGVTTMLWGSGPFGTALTALCRARIGGIEYEVVSVQPWPSLSGSLAHSEVVFSRVEG